MANHTITVINKGSSSESGSLRVAGSRVAGSTVIKHNFSATSASRSFSKINWGSKSLIQKTPLTPMIRALGAGSVVGTVIAGAQLYEKGVSFYAGALEAKTGESTNMRNMVAGVRRYTAPLSYAKMAFWDSMVINPMRIARQNESLNYQRELTGDLIFSKSFYK